MSSFMLQVVDLIRHLSEVDYSGTCSSSENYVGSEIANLSATV